MWDRTLTIGSAGKSFSVTGWKVDSAPTARSATRPTWMRADAGTGGTAPSVAAGMSRPLGPTHQVGWLIGPAQLLGATTRAHSRIAFCVATPLQVGRTGCTRIRDVLCAVGLILSA